MHLIKFIWIPILITCSLFSCKSEVIECQYSDFSTGLLVLNEGLFQQNNSTLSFYNEQNNSTTQQAFNAANDRNLGDTGNDMLRYGAKIYIATNVSGQIEVIQPNTLTLIKQIPILVSGNSRQPRTLVAHQSSIYVTNFDGTVVVIDTASLEISSVIDVGRNPEGIDVFQNKLYVANSGGLDAPNYDSTISVIDPVSNSVIQTIYVQINPSKIVTTNQFLFAISRGNYTDIDPVLQKIDPAGNTVTDIPNVFPRDMIFHQNKLYLAYSETLNGVVKIGIFNPISETFDNPSLIDNIQVTTFYGFDMDETGRIYLKDANGYVNSGKVLVYDNSGTFLFEFTTGLNPNTILKID